MQNFSAKKGFNMKKRLLAALMAGAMALSMTACGSSSDGEETQSSGDGTATAGSYTVGIVQLQQHVALDAATQGFQDKLTELIEADGGSVEFDYDNASGDSANCTTIVNGFVSSGVDLIMANATAALQAAQSATADIPILGTSISDYGTALGVTDWTGTTGTNISGTTDLAPLDGQADMIQELFPDAANVGMLYCSAEYAFTDSNDVASVAQNAASNSDVIYIPTDNTAASCTEAIANVVIPAGVPVVAGEQGICSGCGVATLSIDYYELGEVTAEMAYEILVNDADPGTMEIQSAPNFTKMYNAANAETLGVTIPDDYTAIE